MQAVKLTNIPSLPLQSMESRPATPRAYDKFNYAVVRQKEQRETCEAIRTPRSDHRHTVVRPLHQNRFGFAIAEDGVIHSRIVSPPRNSFAPVAFEVSRADAIAMGAEEAALDDPWERVKLATGAATDADLSSFSLKELRNWCSRIDLTLLESARVELRWKSTGSDSAGPVEVLRDTATTTSNTTPSPGRRSQQPHQKPIFSEKLSWESRSRVDCRRKPVVRAVKDGL